MSPIKSSELVQEREPVENLTVYFNHVKFVLREIVSKNKEVYMYKLMVSYNGGLSYSCEAEGETPEELRLKARRFTEKKRKWVIENAGGELKDVCPINQRAQRANAF